MKDGKRRIQYQKRKSAKLEKGYCDDCANDNHVDCARWKPKTKQPTCKCPKCKSGKYMKIHGPVPEKEMK